MNYKHLFHPAAIIILMITAMPASRADIPATVNDAGKTWEVEIVKSATKEVVLRDTLHSSSFLLPNLQANVEYFVRVRTKTFVYSGWTASEVFVRELSTEIHATASDSFRYTSSGGTMVITADRDAVLPLFTVDGRLIRLLRLSKGTTEALHIPPGIYLIDRQKVIVK
ncbi:MAG: hypothetical protein LBC40_05120 [Dysgonamonadaceae bacterium]|nr:hypothetical protein [Dysgonamonadaceae bacterium]